MGKSVCSPCGCEKIIKEGRLDNFAPTKLYLRRTHHVGCTNVAKAEDSFLIQRLEMSPPQTYLDSCHATRPASSARPSRNTIKMVYTKPNAWETLIKQFAVWDETSAVPQPVFSSEFRSPFGCAIGFRPSLIWF